jgi:hypothetical protein
MKESLGDWSAGVFMDNLALTRVACLRAIFILSLDCKAALPTVDARGLAEEETAGPSALTDLLFASELAREDLSFTALEARSFEALDFLRALLGPSKFREDSWFSWAG